MSPRVDWGRWVLRDQIVIIRPKLAGTNSFYQSLAVSGGADEPPANTNLRAMPPVRREAGAAQATASNVP